MKGFTRGLIAGGIIGILGLTYAASDRRLRRKMVKDGHRVMDGANKVIDNITGML